jgi:hypothetical protein
MKNNRRKEIIMEQKMIPEYEYLGLGFPIMLKNVVCLKMFVAHSHLCIGTDENPFENL